MTPQTAAARPEFSGFSNLQQLENLKLHAQQAKAMSTDYKDTVDRVIAKLSTLDDLFAFYWIAGDKVEFQKNSISGLTFIISDCVNELKRINKT